MLGNPNLLPAEYKAATSVVYALMKEEEILKPQFNLEALLSPPEVTGGGLLFSRFQFFRVPMHEAISSRVPF